VRHGDSGCKTMINGNGKRPASGRGGVLLGTDWGKRPLPPAVKCDCNLCTTRDPGKIKMNAERLRREGKVAFLCVTVCGGTLVAGKQWSTCKRREHRITICSGCTKEVHPEWKVSKAERERLIGEHGWEKAVLWNLEILEMGAMLEAEAESV